MPDVVGLKINGQTLAGWEAVTIERSIDNVASAFSLSGPFDPELSELRSAFKPFGYQSAQVSIDEQLIITGRLESVSPGVSAGVRAINAQGRSLTGPLVDCAVDIDRFQFDGLSLSTIAIQVCRPHGIGVFAVNDTNPIKEARCEPGQTGFAFLNALAQDVGLLLTDDSAGRLIIKKLQPTGLPVAAIVEGDGPVMEISGSYDGSARFSRYKVLQQQDGEPAITGTAEDSGVSIYRPSVVTGAEGNANAVNDAAKWRRALALAGAVSVTARVSGWRNNAGKIWTPGDVVTVYAPGAFIMRESPFIIAAATLTLDVQNGRTTQLRLVLPATYTGEMPGSYPWE